MAEKQLRTMPRFSGSFFTWRKVLFTDRNKGESRNLLVYSSGSRAAVLEYLWLKFLWDELTRIEFTLFIGCLTEGSGDFKKWASLEVLTSEIPKRILRKRILEGEKILGEKPSSRERYLGYKGMRIEIQEEKRRLPKVPKFSGYVRNISAIGRGNRINQGIEPWSDSLPDDSYIEKKFNWVEFLRVGAISLFLSQGEILLHPDDSKLENLKDWDQ